MRGSSCVYISHLAAVLFLVSIVVYIFLYVILLKRRRRRRRQPGDRCHSPPCAMVYSAAPVKFSRLGASSSGGCKTGYTGLFCEACTNGADYPMRSDTCTLHPCNAKYFAYKHLSSGGNDYPACVCANQCDTLEPYACVSRRVYGGLTHVKTKWWYSQVQYKGVILSIPHPIPDCAFAYNDNSELTLNPVRIPTVNHMASQGQDLILVQDAFAPYHVLSVFNYDVCTPYLYRFDSLSLSWVMADSINTEIKKFSLGTDGKPISWRCTGLVFMPSMSSYIMQLQRLSVVMTSRGYEPLTTHDDSVKMFKIGTDLKSMEEIVTASGATRVTDLKQLFGVNGNYVAVGGMSVTHGTSLSNMTVVTYRTDLFVQLETTIYTLLTLNPDVPPTLYSLNVETLGQHTGYDNVMSNYTRVGPDKVPWNANTRMLTMALYKDTLFIVVFDKQLYIYTIPKTNGQTFTEFFTLSCPSCQVFEPIIQNERLFIPMNITRNTVTDPPQIKTTSQVIRIQTSGTTGGFTAERLYKDEQEQILAIQV